MNREDIANNTLFGIIIGIMIGFVLGGFYLTHLNTKCLGLTKDMVYEIKYLKDNCIFDADQVCRIFFNCSYGYVYGDINCYCNGKWKEYSIVDVIEKIRR